MQKTPYDLYALVYKLHLTESKFEIAEDLRLKRLDSELTTTDISCLGPGNFDEFSLLSPYVRECTCEIQSFAQNNRQTRKAYMRTYLFSALLNLRGFMAHRCIACIPFSWDTIAGREKRSKIAFDTPAQGKWEEQPNTRAFFNLPPYKPILLDFYRSSHIVKGTSAKPFDGSDAQWFEKNFATTESLYENSKVFELAMNYSTEWRFLQDKRAAIGYLWSGIESFFDVPNEITFRLSAMTASLLEPRGLKRKEKFESIKKLYALRSKAVHGKKMSEKELHEAMFESYYLLRALLFWCLDNNRVLDKSDFDKALFE